MLRSPLAKPHFALGLLVLLLAACGSRDGGANATSAPVLPTVARTFVPSVTTTSSPAANPVTSIELETAFPGLRSLDRPVEMLQLPGTSAFIVAEQDGTLVAFDSANPSNARTALDHADSVSREGNEEGLLGMALSPSFASDGYLYLYYSPSDGPRRTRISRMETSGSGAAITVDPASELVILEIEQPFSNHKGGKLAFGPDQMLYLGVGDGGSGGDPRGYGQDLEENLLGSIIRIDVSKSSAAEPYAVPGDNPFADDNEARPETWAFGLRNPWRFSFDRETGDLWAGDVGQSALEEIDLILPGGNYGWNIMEGDECYEASSCDQDGLILPVVAYGRDDG
ncbi:MAG TPA: PQQ-dependent sugar dehydrogenase, partial [Tepidiformaceae bacterium]|nr:PQQ-dependent sugar dehydrogenase [Tepidiformaceae bacterium]